MARPLKLASYLALSTRNVILFVAGLVLTGFTLYISFIVSMVLGVASSVSAPDVDYEKVTREGKQTKGVVTGINVMYNTSINGEHPTDIFYTYKAETDSAQGHYRALDSRAVEELSIGDEIDVMYLGDDSLIVNMKRMQFTFKDFYMIVGPILLVLVSLMLFAIINTILRARILKHGRVVEASVVAITRKSPFSNIGTVVYEYTASRGERLKGSSKTKDIMMFLDKKPGDTFKIFVSPSNERKTSLIPAAEVARNGWVI